MKPLLSITALALMLGVGVVSVSPALARNSICEEIEARIAATEDEIMGMFIGYESIWELRKENPNLDDLDDQEVARAYFRMLVSDGKISTDVDESEWIKAFTRPLERSRARRAKLQYLERRHEGLIRVAEKRGCPF